jgi:ketosteroid isomerase-like protein
MDRNHVTRWVALYEHAWRAPGTDELATIFADDACYLQAPYREPVVGLADIATMWEQHRDGPDEVFRLTSEVVAVDDDTAVVRVDVCYGDPVDQEYRDLWVLRFAEDGRCSVFEEWPFWPNQPSASTEG